MDSTHLILRIDQIQIFQRIVRRTQQIVLQVGDILDISALMAEDRLQLVKFGALIGRRFLILVVNMLRTIIGNGLLRQECKFLRIVVVLLMVVILVVAVGAVVHLLHIVVVVGVIRQLFVVVPFLLLIVRIDAFTCK